jgi:transcriptional regulator of acetoin/glycerol metabolism
MDRLRALGPTEALAMATTPGDALGGDGASSVSSPRTRTNDEPLHGAPLSARSSTPSSPPLDDPQIFDQAYKDFREAWIDRGEKEYVRRLLFQHNRNVSAAARKAGIDRTYMYRLIRKHDL